MAKGRVLAVDDQRYFRELLEGLLAASGYEGRSVASGEEALRLLEQGPVDVVLTDLVMPGMDGSELVRRVKERHPDQEVVVATGVVDVRTAVEAMRLGAADYLIKPFDAEVLGACLDSILERRRLRTEHSRLLAENIEFLGERSLFERAIGLFSSLEVAPLAERLVEGLCVETQAQGGVLWAQDAEEPGRLVLTVARGLVRLEAEPRLLDAQELPAGLGEPGARSALEDWGRGSAGARQALFLPLRRERELLGLVRLSDKQGGGGFDVVDRSCAEKLVRFGEMALTHALRLRALERPSLEDPITGAYVLDYWRDATQVEIQKARRAGRRFSVMKLDVGPLEGPRVELGAERVARWQHGLVEHLRLLLRTGDLIALDPGGALYALLAESDELGAAVLKERTRRSLLQSELLCDLPASWRPEPRIAVATWPGDGEDVAALGETHDQRLADELRSPVRVLGLERMSFTQSLRALLAESDTEDPRSAEQIVRFVLAEVARRPRDAGLLFVGPGEALGAPVRDALAALRGSEAATEIVVVGEEGDAAGGICQALRGGRAPADSFLLRYGDGPPYALVRERGDGRDGVRLYHSDDRRVVEHLIFQLQSELAGPRAAAS